MAVFTEQDFQRLNKVSPAPNELKGQRSVADYLCLFDDVELAADLFFLLETGCVMAWMREYLLGLAKQFGELQAELSHILRQDKQNALSHRVEELAHFQLFGKKGVYEWDVARCATGSQDQTATSAIISHLPELYDGIAQLSGPYVRPPLMNLLGKNDINRTAIEIERKRQQTQGHLSFSFSGCKKRFKTNRNQKQKRAQQAAAPQISLQS